MNTALRDQLEPLRRDRMKGYIHRLYSTYGFIRVKPAGAPRYDVFFHEKSLNVESEHVRKIKQVEPGDLVSFEIDNSDSRGPVAVNIEVEEQEHNIN